MLAKIKRTYSGQEGRRVKAGTIFAVDKAEGGLPVMSLQRFRQLQQVGLAETVEAQGDDPQGKPAPKPGNKMEPDSRPQPGQRQRRAPPLTPSPARADARRRQQEDSPKPPRRLRPAGGQSGTQEPPPSSSPEVRQAGSVTIKQRGTRRAQARGGSPSTTPSGSSPGQTSSTPATPPGGVTISKQPEDSAAFD